MNRAFEGHRPQEVPELERVLGEAADKGGEVPSDRANENRVTFSDAEIEAMMEKESMTREEVLAKLRRAGEAIHEDRTAA